MTFQDYWTKLIAKKGGTCGNVSMTAEQFEKMLHQAYDIGYRAGGEQAKKIREMLDQYAAGRTGGSNSEKIKDNAFDELLKEGGDFGDILSGLFGKKKT